MGGDRQAAADLEMLEHLDRLPLALLKANQAPPSEFGWTSIRLTANLPERRSALCSPCTIQAMTACGD